MRYALSALALLGMILMSGCGACPKVARHREAFLAAQAQAPKDTSPQVVLALPKAMVDGWLRKAVDQLPVAGFRPPGLGELSRYATGYDFKAERLAATVSKSEDAHFDLDLAVRRSQRRLFGVELGAVAPARFDRRSRKLRIGLRADMFERVRPKLEDGAVDRFATALLSQVPAAARALLPRDLVRRLAQQGIDALSGQVYSLVRAKLLTPLGELAHFEVQLPDLPLESVALGGGAAGWTVGARTSLPGRGVAASGINPRGASASQAGMRISTAALASLGNWAMANGRLPGRYTREGKADKQGELVAGVSWDQGPAPLKAHLWTKGAAEASEQSMCLYVRAAAKPSIRMKDGRLDLSFAGASVEELMGPPLVNKAITVLGLTERVVDFGRSMALDTRIKLGKGEQAVEVVGASLDADTLGLNLRLASGGPARRPSSSASPFDPFQEPASPVRRQPGAQLHVAAHPACGGTVACGR